MSSLLPCSGTRQRWSAGGERHSDNRCSSVASRAGATSGRFWSTDWFGGSIFIGIDLAATLLVAIGLPENIGASAQVPFNVIAGAVLYHFTAYVSVFEQPGGSDESNGKDAPAEIPRQLNIVATAHQKCRMLDAGYRTAQIPCADMACFNHRYRCAVDRGVRP